MIDYSSDEEQRRRYLLGDLSEEQRTSVEEEYFTDDDAFERLLAAEHDLVDEYVRGTLPPTERERAEEWVGKDKAKVAVAKALMQWKAGTAETARAQLPSRSRSQLRPASWARARLITAVATACSVAAAAAAVWLLNDRGRLRAELDRVRRDEAALQSRETALQAQADAQLHRSEQLAQELKREHEQRTVAELESSTLKQLTRVATAVLLPSLRGGQRQNQVTLTRAIERAELQIRLEDADYRYFRATISTLQDKRIWQSGPLEAQRVNSHRVLLVTVPARVLQGGDYFLHLSGFEGRGPLEDVGEYYFRVIRK